MANDNLGGKRLAGNHAPGQKTPVTSQTEDYSYRPASVGGVEESVVDDILRSITEQDSSSSRRAARKTAADPEQPAAPRRPVVENEYQAAAHNLHQQQTVQQTTAVPPVDPYYLRDPSHTQSFQPARPTHRDTDRIPTLVDEKPVKRNTVLSKVLTFLVVILIIIALVLGVQMVYILGPSLGWNLPDLSKLPGVSWLVQHSPSEEEPVEPEPVETQQPEEMPIPTAVTLDMEEIVLHEGESAVLTAALDVEGWDGLLYWASGKEEVATVTQLGAYTAQVDYVSEGTCYIAVKLGVKPADGSDAPYATCRVECVGAEEPAAPEQTVPEDEPETAVEHIDVVLNRDDFTLNVGESHQLMTENADQMTWTSSKESVVTVDANGVVKAVGRGTATVTATGPDGTTASAIARVR